MVKNVYNVSFFFRKRVSDCRGGVVGWSGGEGVGLLRGEGVGLLEEDTLECHLI